MPLRKTIRLQAATLRPPPPEATNAGIAGMLRYLQLVDARWFLCGAATARARRGPGDQQRPPGEKLRHDAQAWAHLAQVGAEGHAGGGG